MTPASAALARNQDEKDCWRRFKPGTWCTAIDVRDFIVRNVTPYARRREISGRRRRSAPRRSGPSCSPISRRRRKKGVLAVDAQIAVDAAGAQGRLHRPRQRGDRRAADRSAVQARDLPVRRLAHGRGRPQGRRASRPIRRCTRPSRSIARSHNDGVFDAYTPEIMRCRKSGIITGLPDAYGRGRIIGDYRRVALYGVDRLLEAKQEERAQIDDMWPTDEVIRTREELADQIRALKDLAAMAKLYDCDITRPANDAQRGRAVDLSRPISAPSRRRTARRCRSAASRASSTSTSSATCAKARWTKPARRSCGTSWSRSCASCASCARRTTTRCSAATPTGRPNASAAWI